MNEKNRPHSSAEDRSQSDAQLLNLMQNGNFQAFRALFLRHARGIYDLAHTQTQSDSAARHLLQIVFERFWDRRGAIAPTDSARGYLMEIADDVFPAIPVNVNPEVREIAEDPDIEKLWQKFESRMSSASRNQPSGSEFSRAFRRFSSRILPQRRFRPTYLSMVIVMFAMLVIYAWFKNHEMSGITEIRTKTGETLERKLPDGSKTTVNEQSKLRFANRFSDSLRVVFLTGEATFTGIPENNRAFAIVTNEAAATLFGTDTTIFSVASRDSVTTVTVQRGFVAFRAIRDSAGPEIYISAGNAATCRFNHDPVAFTADTTAL